MSKIKYFSSTHGNTPTLDNNWGDLTTLLDALLVNGFNPSTVTSLVKVGSTVTATTSGTHTYHVGAILILAGSLQPEYNIEVEVLSTTTTTFTFSDAGLSWSGVTGTITTKIAPLGFEAAFTDGSHKRAYRSALAMSSKPILLVDAGAKGTNTAGTTYGSTWAKWANVGIVQDMTDINTVVGSQAPFDPAYPTRNRDGGGLANQYGWAKWYWAMIDASQGEGDDYGSYGSPAAGNRPWALVGDGRSFYLWLARGFGSAANAMTSYGFGECKSFKATDAKAAWLMADSWAASTTGFDSNTIGAYNSFGAAGAGTPRGYGGGGANGKWLLESFNGLTQGQGFTLLGMSGVTVSGGGGALLPVPNGPDYALWLHQPIYLREDTGHMRGVMPGLAHIPHAAPYPDRYRIPASASNGNKDWLVVRSSYSTSYGQNPGGAQVALQISGEWEY